MKKERKQKSKQAKNKQTKKTSKQANKQESKKEFPYINELLRIPMEKSISVQHWTNSLLLSYKNYIIRTLKFAFLLFSSIFNCLTKISKCDMPVPSDAL